MQNTGPSTSPFEPNFIGADPLMTDRKLDHGRSSRNCMAMSNFKAEIVSLRDCLKDRHFIPDMQRQYEWATNSGGKHVPKLWESLLEFDSNDPDHEDEYYTGTLICYKEGESGA